MSLPSRPLSARDPLPDVELRPLHRRPSAPPSSSSSSSSFSSSDSDSDSHCHRQRQRQRHSDDDDADADAADGMSRSRRAGLSKQGPSTMNPASAVELRRKHHATDASGSTPSAQQAAVLLEHESFSLGQDHDPSKPAAASLRALSPQDRRNFFLLVLLYFLQGVPMGLAMGSVPFLLKHRLSYGQIGVFTLASYPYSMKLLWSPIVDAIWSPRVGRRKSWIVPVQAVSAVMLLWLGGQAEKLMDEAANRLYFFTWVFFCLVMLCATQDIAVDGVCLPLRVARPGQLLTACRLGVDADLPRKSLVRLDRPDGRPDGRPVPLLHRLPRLQLARVLQQVVPLVAQGRRPHDPRRLPLLLGLGLPASHRRPLPGQARGEDQQSRRHPQRLQDHVAGAEAEAYAALLPLCSRLHDHN